MTSTSADQSALLAFGADADPAHLLLVGDLAPADGAAPRVVATVQLGTDKSRTAARRFYERLGFTASHEGIKLLL